MNPDYMHYSAIELALDDSFISFVISDNERYQHVWNKWITDHPHKKKDVEEAIAMIQAIRSGLVNYTNVALPIEVENTLLQKIQYCIQQQAQSIQTETKERSLNWIWRFAAAAIILGGIVGYLLLSSITKQEPQSLLASNLSYQQHINTSVVADTLILPDGSQVILYPNSELAYSKFSDDTLRKVILKGSAQFHVRKDSQKAFVVFTNQIATHVLGTSFTIEENLNKDEIKVVVTEGKVAVTEHHNQQLSSQQEPQLLVQANHIAHYQISEGRFHKRLVENPQKLPSANHIALEYKAAPLKDVLHDIQQVFGIPLVYDLQIAQHCQLTASLSDESFFDILKIICTSNGLKYQIVETSVIITGKGCSDIN